MTLPGKKNYSKGKVATKNNSWQRQQKNTDTMIAVIITIIVIMISKIIKIKFVIQNSQMK